MIVALDDFHFRRSENSATKIGNSAQNSPDVQPPKPEIVLVAKIVNSIKRTYAKNRLHKNQMNPIG